jgi:hypothetical protein
VGGFCGNIAAFKAGLFKALFPPLSDLGEIVFQWKSEHLVYSAWILIQKRFVWS